MTSHALSVSHEIDDVATRIREFIVTSFLLDHLGEQLTHELDLIGSGVLDSLALVEVATFLEHLSGRKLEWRDLNPDNMGSIARMATYVVARRATAGHD